MDHPSRAMVRPGSARTTASSGSPGTTGTSRLGLGAAAVALGASMAPAPPPAPPHTHNGLIAYASNYDIWVTSADLSDARQLTHLAGVTSSPQWSPDGTRLSAWHAEDGVVTVLILGTDGSVLQTLSAPEGYTLPTSTDDRINPFAAWSPASKRLRIRPRSCR